MQIGSEQLKSQQQVLKALNLYSGKIDGIWGPDTIAAKIKWERSGKFAPGIPNNGFPLPDRGPFPSGVRRNSNGTLTCLELDLKPAEVEQPVVRAQNQQHNSGKHRNDKPVPTISIPLNPEAVAVVPDQVQIPDA